jgi:imidazolonepropionase
LTNISQLVTPVSAGRGALRGADMCNLRIIPDAAVFCADGKILAVGPRKDVEQSNLMSTALLFDCDRGVVLPGFVDSHTHPVFTSPRLIDFEKRIAGATYEEIAAAGGGIRSSATGVRLAKLQDLTKHVLSGIERLVAEGTSTVECKSGYGLTVESELRSLQAIRMASGNWLGTTFSTLLGAHTIPAEMKDRPDEYVDIVCNEMIPAAAEQKLADFVDVFCEQEAFTLSQTEQIFKAATREGLPLRAHVGQFTVVELGRLLRFKPVSLDHLDYISDSDLQMLAQSETIATLLPGAAYFLGHKEYPPARKFIDSGVAIALATDYNPGTSPTASMPMILSLACTQMKMSVEEAITAATLNGAHALRFGEWKGSIETGKDADLAIFDAREYREIAYWFGSSRCRATVLAGTLVEHRPVPAHSK